MWFIQIKQLNPSPLFPLSVFLPRKPCFSYPVPEEKANLNSLFPCYTRSLFLPSCSVTADLCHCSRSCRMGGLSRREEDVSEEISPPRVHTECPWQLDSGAEQQSFRGLDRDVPSLSATHKTSCVGAWLNFHYVFIMPSALYPNHSSCLSFCRYPGKWSNNQMTSLTE